MKVRAFEIPKSINENLIVQENCLRYANKGLHSHEEIQITYIVEGRGKVFVSNYTQSFSSGDFFVIGSNCPHSFRQYSEVSESHNVSLFFTHDAFGKDFFGISQLEQISSFFGLLDYGFKLSSYQPSIDNLMRRFSKSDRLSRFILFIKLIDEVCKYEKKNFPNVAHWDSIKADDDSRITRVLDYTYHNFQKEITLDKISDIACMTPSAFCRFFKQRTNRTFFSYLIELRIMYACKLLRQEKSPSINNVSNVSGFRSITNFNRKFKAHIGVTPSTYVNQFSII